MGLNAANLVHPNSSLGECPVCKECRIKAEVSCKCGINKIYIASYPGIEMIIKEVKK